jgi:uncharacterized phage protein (TIGR02218 family)
MKTVSANLDTHTQQEVTTLAQCWKVKRIDGEIFTFTTADIPLPIDIGDGDGELTYNPDDSFSRSAISSNDSLSTDHLEVTGFTDFPDLVEEDFRNGIMDGSEVKIFLVNYNALADGIMKLRKGKLGHAKLGDKGVYQAELMGSLQAYSRRRSAQYLPKCQVNLGDPNTCGVPIYPDEVLRNTTYILGNFVRASNNKVLNQTVTNPGAESGVTGWTNEIGVLDSADVQVTARTGSNYFAGGNAEAETKAYQDITVPGAQEAEIDAGNRSIGLSWYQNGIASSSDTGEMTVKFFDGVSAQIGAEASAGLTHNDSGWVGRQMEVSIPPLTRTIRIHIHGVRNTGSDVDAFFDDIVLDILVDNVIAEDFHDRIFEVTTAGTTDVVQPSFNLTISGTTTDGTVVFTARDAWTRAAEVTAVDGTDPRKKFTVTELTPNTGAGTDGRTQFPDDSMNGGLIVFESGDNKGVAREIKDFVADDGVTITQDLVMHLDFAFDIQIGDKLRINRGCDFSRTVCRDIFANMDNYRGFPDVPGQGVFATPDVE